MALAKGRQVWQSTCVGSVLRNGTSLRLLHRVSGPMAPAWPGQTLVLGYVSGCKQLLYELLYGTGWILIFIERGGLILFWLYFHCRLLNVALCGASRIS